MALAFGAIIVGLVLLVWSADRFVDGAAATARHFGMPALLVGMVIVGFGTSAPELVVSATSALQGNPGLALGNAYGSNITNIGLILGITALVSPLVVRRRALLREVPILLAITGLVAIQLLDGTISRGDAVLMLVVFAAIMAWTIARGMRTAGQRTATPGGEDSTDFPLAKALLLLVVGLVVLIASSRMLVWGAVDIAQRFGVSDLIIGLTIVAIGTSLPELASSVAAARKGEHDIALGNVLGSNLFNTLAVVGLAGVLHPMSVGPEVLSRDISVMAVFAVALLVLGLRKSGHGTIGRSKGLLLLIGYLAYAGYLLWSAFQ